MAIIVRDDVSDMEPGNSLDAVIDLYKAGIDRTLVEANLRRSIDERIAELQRLFDFAEELRRAARAAKLCP